MKLSTLILIFTISPAASAQIVQSSCEAPDSIIENYRMDATLLTLRRIHSTQNTYKDSVKIPESHIDTVLNAMIAVYNAISIPERDTVIYLFEIEPIYDYIFDKFSVRADDELPWMEQLQLGNSPSGFGLLDSIVSTYGFSLNNYSSWPGFDIAYFKTTNIYNIKALTQLLESHPDVIYAGATPLLIDGYDMEHTVNEDHVELRYVLRWGDCISGCTGERTYVFKVYYDCSVQFVESFGDTDVPASYASVEMKKPEEVEVWPNPANEQLNIKGINGNFTYKLTDLSGKTIISATLSNSDTIDLTLIQSGNFLLEILKGDERIVRRILKQ